MYPPSRDHPLWWSQQVGYPLILSILYLWNVSDMLFILTDGRADGWTGHFEDKKTWFFKDFSTKLFKIVIFISLPLWSDVFWENLKKMKISKKIRNFSIFGPTYFYLFNEICIKTNWRGRLIPGRLEYWWQHTGKAGKQICSSSVRKP